MADKDKSKDKKGNIFKILIIVMLSLIIVGGSAFGGMYFASKSTPKDNSKATKTEVVNEVTYSLDECLVNLSDEDGKRYIKVKIYIGYEDNKKLAAELEVKKPIIRDAVNGVLRSKKTTDFNETEKGIDTIRKELLAGINPVLTNGQVSHVYFYDILVQ